jgi:hypothetical protein
MVKITAYRWGRDALGTGVMVQLVNDFRKTLIFEMRQSYRYRRHYQIHQA